VVIKEAGNVGFDQLESPAADEAAFEGRLVVETLIEASGSAG
jgi:hypothetical protein